MISKQLYNYAAFTSKQANSLIQSSNKKRGLKNGRFILPKMKGRIVTDQDRGTSATEIHKIRSAGN